MTASMSSRKVPGSAVPTNQNGRKMGDPFLSEANRSIVLDAFRQLVDLRLDTTTAFGSAMWDSWSRSVLDDVVQYVARVEAPLRDRNELAATAARDRFLSIALDFARVRRATATPATIRAESYENPRSQFVANIRSREFAPRTSNVPKRYTPEEWYATVSDHARRTVSLE